MFVAFLGPNMLPGTKPRNKSSCCELAGWLCYSTEVLKIRKTQGQHYEGEYVNKTEVVIAALERAPDIVIPWFRRFLSLS